MAKPKNNEHMMPNGKKMKDSMMSKSQKKRMEAQMKKKKMYAS